MIFFDRPCDHDRFNALIHELSRLNFQGAVCIFGSWDPDVALQYLEKKALNRIIATLREDGSAFILSGKYVFFYHDRVLLTTSLKYIGRPRSI
jgi:hypothetical protein